MYIYIYIRKHLKKTHTDTQMKLYNVVARPTLLYGRETWVTTKRDMTRLEAAEMRFLRSVQGYTRLDKIRNEVIRKKNYKTWDPNTNRTGSTISKEWTTADFRNTPSATNLEEKEIVDAPANDGNASMPNRSNDLIHGWWWCMYVCMYLCMFVWMYHKNHTAIKQFQYITYCPTKLWQPVCVLFNLFLLWVAIFMVLFVFPKMWPQFITFRLCEIRVTVWLTPARFVTLFQKQLDGRLCSCIQFVTQKLLVYLRCASTQYLTGLTTVFHLLPPSNRKINVDIVLSPYCCFVLSV